VTERGNNAILTLVTICLTLLACEFGLRAWHGVPLFDFPDWRSPVPLRLRETIRFDAALGWALNDNFSRPDLHTVASGIRRNSAQQTGPRPGNVVAVGASVTQGLELDDEQSWPAQLELRLGRPVDNAAVVGYALDQIVLRAEQLLPLERPQLLLLGIETSNILWNRSAVVWGVSKPFFTVEGDALRIHNVPVATSRLRSSPLERVKAVLGRSYLIDRAMAWIDPADWYIPQTRDNNGSPDPIDVSCRLLRRLKQRLDQFGTGGVFIALPEWGEVVSTKAPGREIAVVQECARRAGWHIVDLFPALQAEFQSDAQRFSVYWQARHIHYSAAGNRHLADLIGEALATEQRQSEAH
jgi:hypothetical protein